MIIIFLKMKIISWNVNGLRSAYKWRTDSAQFFLYAENLCINDQEALDIANLLNPELIFVGKYINIDIPTRDF